MIFHPRSLRAARALGRIAMAIPVMFFLASPASAEKPTETLNVRDLKPNERILFDYLSISYGVLLKRIYSIDGGGDPTFTALELESHYDGKKKELENPMEPIGTAELSRDEINGIDIYLAFLRSRYKSNCPATDTITVDYYRDDKLIGRETFEDATCVSTWFTRQNGEIVVKGEVYRDFPPDLLQSMVPVLLVEQRIWEERRKAEREEAGG